MQGKFPFSAIALTFVFSASFSQTFERTFGSTATEIGTCIQNTLDGNYIICGSANGFSNAYADYYLVKVNSAGTLLWSKNYGGTNHDRAYYVSTCSDGGFIMTGYTLSTSAGNNEDVYLVRTDSNGSLLWSTSVGGSKDDLGWYVLEANDGGFIVSGSSKSFTGGSWDGYLVKVNSAGVLQWTKVMGGSSTDVFNGMSKTTDGGYIITGETMTNSFGSTDMMLVKINSDGDTLWTKQYGKITEDAGNAVTQTADGGYIIVGDMHTYPNSGDHNACLLKTDSDGAMQWVKLYGSNPGTEIAWAVRQTPDNGYVMLASSYFYGAGNADMLLIRTDNSGGLKWAKTYGSSGFDDVWYFQKTANEGNMIIGATQSYGSGQADIYLVRTDSLGNTSCDTSSVIPFVNTPTLQFRSGFTITTGGTASTPTTTSSSPSTLSTDPCNKVSVSEDPTITQDVVVYPNPFSESALIKIADLSEETILKVYDVFGHEIKPVLTRNSDGFLIRKNNLSQGIYFYILHSAGKAIITGKFVIE